MNEVLTVGGLVAAIGAAIPILLKAVGKAANIIIERLEHIDDKVDNVRIDLRKDHQALSGKVDHLTDIVIENKDSIADVRVDVASVKSDVEHLKEKR